MAFFLDFNQKKGQIQLPQEHRNASPQVEMDTIKDLKLIKLIPSPCTACIFWKSTGYIERLLNVP